MYPIEGSACNFECKEPEILQNMALLCTCAGRVLEHAGQTELQAAQEQQAQEPAEAERTVQPSEAAAPAGPAGRRSSTGALARERAAQVNKWGFAPGGEDTLDINLELQGQIRAQPQLSLGQQRMQFSASAIFSWCLYYGSRLSDARAPPQE